MKSLSTHDLSPKPLQFTATYTATVDKYASHGLTYQRPKSLALSGLKDSFKPFEEIYAKVFNRGTPYD